MFSLTMATKTLIPITRQLKTKLKAQCRKEGRTYDSLISQMLIDYKIINEK